MARPRRRDRRGSARAAALVGAAAMLSGAGAPARAETNVYCHRPAGGEEHCIRSAAYAKDLCRVLEHAAVANALPTGFFARLIWTESRFDPNAVSPMNAQGVAQFIPSTARLRGLKNPFNPAEALWASATYLAELRGRYGNLGLAAAAYNAGEGRVSAILNRGAGAPYETLNYVAVITGAPLDDWKDQKPKTISYALQDGVAFAPACLEMATKGAYRRFSATPSAAVKPWGAQVGAHAKRAVALRIFQRVKRRFSKLIGGETAMVVRERGRGFGRRSRYAVRIGRDSRAAAQKLCNRLRRAGAACVVARTR